MGSTHPRASTLAFVVGEVAAVFRCRGARWEYETQRAALGEVGFADVIAHAPFLGRALSFVLLVEGREQYLLTPRTHHELDELVRVARLLETGREVARPAVRVALVGTAYPLDPAGADPLPGLVVEAVHHWTDAPPPATDAGEAAAVWERLDRATHNTGVGEGDRALNFVVTRSAELRARIAALLDEGCSGIRVHHEPCRLAHPRRREVNVVLAWTSRAGAPDAASLRVDVTGMHPFPTDGAFRPYHPKLGGA